MMVGLKGQRTEGVKLREGEQLSRGKSDIGH